MEAFGREVEARRAEPRREPMLRAPAPALALVATILAAYALQAALLPLDAAAARFGVSGDDLAADGGLGGGALRLVTALFVHAGWSHAGLNALGALAFGAPVARTAGGGVRGALTLFGFYLLCGALASLGYAALAPHAVLIGASGAVSGLMGAASRRPMGAGGPARLLPLTARPVLGMAAGWTIVNLLIGLSGADVGSGGAPVAWQAHLVGYAAGVLLAPALPWVGGGVTGRAAPRPGGGRG